MLEHRLQDIVKELKKIEKGNSKHSSRTELDKACFVHDALYSDKKYLTKFKKGYKIVLKSISKYGLYFFDKKESGVRVNEKLAEELHKSAIKKFKKGLWKIWRQHLGSRFGNVKYLSCAIDISTKDAWVKSLTEKRLLMLLSKY